METEVNFRVPCEECKGEGRVPPRRLPGGAMTVPSGNGELCPKCRGEKVEQQGWMPLSELRRLIDAG